MKHALAILTCVPEGSEPALCRRLPEAVRSLENTNYPGTVCVVDDGSTSPQHHEYLDSLSDQYRVIRRNTNGGVSRGKNTCIRVLMDLGIDVGFLAEDDIQFHKGWLDQYWNAHQRTGIQHFSWAWDRDPSGLMRKQTRLINQHQIVQTSRVNGVFLTFTPKVIRRVGGFKILPGKWGHTHTNWTRRIIKSGLAPFFADVHDSNRFLTINQFGAYSTISNEKKDYWKQINNSPAKDLSQLFCPVAE